MIVHTPWTVSLSLVAAVIFSFVSFSSYAGIINFLNTNLSMFSFSTQNFRYHKPVIFPDEVIFPVILFESSIFSTPGQILKTTSFLFSIFFFCSFFEQFSFFQNSYPTTISCFWFNNPMTEE